MGRKYGSRGSERAGEGRARRNGSGGLDPSLPVSDFMNRNVVYLREDMWVDAAIESLGTRGLRAAPVLDHEGRPVGILYADDVETVAPGEEDENQRVREGDGDGSGEGFGVSRLARLRRRLLGPGFHVDAHHRARVHEVMVPYVPEIPSEVAVSSAAAVLERNHLDRVMVVDGEGRAVGTFSSEELAEWLVKKTAPVDTDGVLLRDVMRPAVAVGRQTSLLRAREILVARDLRHLPVLDVGAVVGVVALSDIEQVMTAPLDDDLWIRDLVVEDVMRSPAHIAAPEQPLSRFADWLQSAEGACLILEHDGHLVGLVSGSEIDLAASRASGDRARRSPLPL